MRICVAFWTVLLSIVVSAAGALAQSKPASPGGAPKQPPACRQRRARRVPRLENACQGRCFVRGRRRIYGGAQRLESTLGDRIHWPSSAPTTPPSASTAPAGTAAVPTAAPAPGAGSSAAASSRPIDGATFSVRLRDLEQRIDELKEQIRRSHTRLSLLSDTILSGGVGGARSEIEFQNDMSDAFRLTKLLVVLDGAVLYNKVDESGALAEQEKIPIFSGSIPPGDHTVQVKVELRGHGYGVFSYLRGYSFKVENSHSFTVTEGKTVGLNVIAYEKGGITTPLEQRPNVRFVETVTAGVRGVRGKASAPRKAGASATMRAGGQ